MTIIYFFYIKVKLIKQLQVMNKTQNINKLIIEYLLSIIIYPVNNTDSLLVQKKKILISAERLLLLGA
jgi:hypothetical protein